MAAVGRAKDLRRTEACGLALGSELAALGIGWNLAPVLDVHTNPANPVIGDRAFGTTSDVVAAHALAFWRGLRAAGLVGCGKHFPGHGDTLLDSHRDLPVVEHGSERLWAVELAPFVSAVGAGIDAIMTAHVVFTALDPERPATLSRRIVTDLLRGELAFEGLVMSDDLSMGAVAGRHTPEALALLAVTAGVDVLLVRRTEEVQQVMFEALVREAETSPAFRARVSESARRMAVLKSKTKVGPPQPGALLPALLGPPAHRALADGLARALEATTGN